MTAKAEALAALAEALTRLASPEPLSALRVSQLRATLEYASVCVERIEQTKRPRRKETKT